jgi:hypothetical protein
MDDPGILIGIGAGALAVMTGAVTALVRVVRAVAFEAQSLN